MARSMRSTKFTVALLVAACLTACQLASPVPQAFVQQRAKAPSAAELGAIGASAVCVMAACDTVIIDVEGHGGHGAAPKGTVDAVLVMGHLITALHSIVSRNHDPSTSSVLTIGSAEAGEAPNVIAGRARLKGTVRCLDPEAKEIMKRRIREVCEGVGATFGAKVALRYVEEAPNVVNDPEAAAEVFAARWPRLEVVSWELAGASKVPWPEFDRWFEKARASKDGPGPRPLTSPPWPCSRPRTRRTGSSTSCSSPTACPTTARRGASSQ